MDGKNKKTYELSFLLEKEDGAQSVLNLLRQHGAEIAEGHRTERIRLAYKIKKMSEAVFGFVRFTAMADAAKALEKDLRVAPGVLRSLVLALSKEALGGQKDKERGLRRVERAAPAERTVFRPKQAARQTEPLSNEALEKKIEEILQ